MCLPELLEVVVEMNSSTRMSPSGIIKLDPSQKKKFLPKRGSSVTSRGQRPTTHVRQVVMSYELIEPCKASSTC